MTPEEIRKRLLIDGASRSPANAQNMAVSKFLKNNDIEGLRNYLKDMGASQIIHGEYGSEINKLIQDRANESKTGLYPKDMNEMLNDRGMINDIAPKPFKGVNITAPDGSLVGGYTNLGTNAINYPESSPHIYEHEAAHMLDNRFDKNHQSNPYTNSKEYFKKLELIKGIDALKAESVGHFRGTRNGLFEEDMLRYLNGIGPKYDPKTDAEYAKENTYDRVKPSLPSKTILEDLIQK
jgi:hypothetical protein